MQPAQHASPRREPGQEVLHAIPAHTVPARRQPRGPEAVAELCDGIAVSAQRLRAIAALPPTWMPPGHRRPPPKAGGRPPPAAAAAGHASGLVLQSLAERIIGTNAAAIPAAAMRVADAWPAWRAVATAWGVITTETRGVAHPRGRRCQRPAAAHGPARLGQPGMDPRHPAHTPTRDLTELPPGGTALLPSSARFITPGSHSPKSPPPTIARSAKPRGQAASTCPPARMPDNTTATSHDGSPPPCTPRSPTSKTPTKRPSAPAAKPPPPSAPSRSNSAPPPRHSPSPAARLCSSTPTASAVPTAESHPADQPTQPGPDPSTGPVAQAVMRLSPPDDVAILRAAAIDRAARALLIEVAETTLRDSPPSIADPSQHAGNPHRRTSPTRRPKLPNRPGPNAVGRLGRRTTPAKRSAVAPPSCPGSLAAHVPPITGRRRRDFSLCHGSRRCVS